MFSGFVTKLLLNRYQALLVAGGAGRSAGGIGLLKNPRWAPRGSPAMPSNATELVWVGSWRSAAACAGLLGPLYPKAGSCLRRRLRLMHVVPGRHAKQEPPHQEPWVP